MLKKMEKSILVLNPNPDQTKILSVDPWPKIYYSTKFSSNSSIFLDILVTHTHTQTDRLRDFVNGSN